MPAPTKRSKDQKKPRARIATAETEAVKRTQVHDTRHIGYTNRGVPLTHLMPWARRCILGFDAEAHADGTYSS